MAPKTNPIPEKPGDGDGIAVRLAVLETHVSAIREDIAEIKPDLKDVRERVIRLEGSVREHVTRLEGSVSEHATRLEGTTGRLDERISQLPTKSFVVSFVASTFTAGFGLIIVAITLQTQIQHWLGIVP